MDQAVGEKFNARIEENNLQDQYAVMVIDEIHVAIFGCVLDACATSEP